MDTENYLGDDMYGLIFNHWATVTVESYTYIYIFIIINWKCAVKTQIIVYYVVQ